MLKKYESSIETTSTRRCTTNDCVATSARSGRITVRYLTRSAAICDCAEPRAAAASSCLLATQIRSRPILPAGGGGGPACPTQSAVVSGMTGGEADPRGTVVKRPHPSALCRIRSRWRCLACSPPVTARYQVSVHSQDTLALIPPPNNPPPPPRPSALVDQGVASEREPAGPAASQPGALRCQPSRGQLVVRLDHGGRAESGQVRRGGGTYGPPEPPDASGGQSAGGNSGR